MHIHTTNGIGVSVLNGLTNCSAIGVTLLNKNDSLLHLVRVPYGPLKVRITAEHEARVELHFEDKKRLETKIPAGTHLLELDDNGQPILFAAPEADEEVYAGRSSSDAYEDPLDPRESPRYANYIEAALTAIHSGKENQQTTATEISAAAPADDDELSFSAVTGGASEQTEIPGYTVEVIGFDDLENGGTGDESPAATEEKPVKSKRRPKHSGFLGIVVQYVEQPPVPGVMPPSYAEAVVAFQLNPPEKHLSAVAGNFHRIVPPEPTTKPWCSCCNH